MAVIPDKGLISLNDATDINNVTDPIATFYFMDDNEKDVTFIIYY
jgi:hypothetical protein